MEPRQKRKDEKPNEPTTQQTIEWTQRSSPKDWARVLITEKDKTDLIRKVSLS